MRYKPTSPRDAANDKFIISKGHAAPIYYAAWAEAGAFPIEKLNTLRKIDSDYEGHPTPRLPFCDVATGSLGQGLGFTCGSAYSSKYFDKIENRYYCLLGDGECAEGSVWEAAEFASFYKLDNLVAIVDVNRLGQSSSTMNEHDVDKFAKRFDAFGWNSIVVDGHDINELVNAFAAARSVKNKPTCIVSRSFKGKYFMNDIEDKMNWHGKPITPKSAEVIAHVESLMKSKDVKLTVNPPTFEFSFPTNTSPYKITPTFDKTKQASTREGYGQGLKALGDSNSNIIGLDADVKNSTFSIYFSNSHPERFIDCYIAEQNMVSVGLGVSKRGKIPFQSTFGAFYSRAFDQIRMSAISFANTKFFGSHSGVHIGQDGPSQMGLEDLTIFRTINNSLVLYPSDAVSAFKSVQLAANYEGLVYIKGGRANHPVLYDNNEEFEVGKAKVLCSSSNDLLTIISAGPPLFECLKVQEMLKAEGKNVRVVDLFSIKPIDKETLEKCAAETGQFFVVEDHYPEGGIGGMLVF